MSFGTCISMSAPVARAFLAWMTIVDSVRILFLLGLLSYFIFLQNCYICFKHMAPPVLFDDLLKMDIPAELRAAIDELLEIKKRTTEKEENSQLPVIKAFIESEIEKQKEIADSLPDDHNKDWSALDRLFLEMLGD